MTIDRKDYMRLALQCNVTLDELRDDKQRERFRKLRLKGQAHPVAVLMDCAMAVNAFARQDLMCAKGLADCDDEDLKEITNRSGFFSAIVLALHGEGFTENNAYRYECEVKEDYPILRAQLPGALACGIDRGLREDYSPVVDLELLSHSRGGLVLLHVLLCALAEEENLSGGEHLDFEAMQDALPCETIAIRLRLLKLYLAVCCGTLRQSELALLDAVLQKACVSFDGDAKAALEHSRLSTQDKLKAAQSATASGQAAAADGGAKGKSVTQAAGAAKVKAEVFEFLEELATQLRSLQSHWSDEEIANFMSDIEGFDEDDYAEDDEEGEYDEDSRFDEDGDLDDDYDDDDGEGDDEYDDDEDEDDDDDYDDDDYDYPDEDYDRIKDGPLALYMGQLSNEELGLADPDYANLDDDYDDTDDDDDDEEGADDDDAPLQAVDGDKDGELRQIVPAGSRDRRRILKKYQDDLIAQTREMKQLFKRYGWKLDVKEEEILDKLLGGEPSAGGNPDDDENK